MSKRLFDEFDSVSAKAWKQKIQVDLKGADYNETLVNSTDEGIDIKPFYHADHHDYEFSLPDSPAWYVTEKLYLENVDITIENAKDVIERGAESLWIIVPEADGKKLEFFEALKDDKTPLYVEVLFQDLEFLKKLNHVLDNQNKKVWAGFDPVHQLASSGNWFKNQKTDFEVFLKTAKFSSFKNQINVDARLYQNSGGLIIQQLAYGLAHLNEYLNVLHQDDSKWTALNVNFVISLGSNYFFEIAKLKAFRLLVSNLASVYEVDIELNIIAEPSKRNHSIYDYNMNMLRTTTECMSGILGGADWVNNLAYDEVFHKRNEFGERISRNQLLILKQESYFDKVLNPVDGTYYIESLTRELAEKALGIFKTIEAGQGFIHQLFEGKIQKKIRESAEKEQAKVNSGEFTLLGLNKYKNLEDRMSQNLELFPFLKQHQRKTLIEPILEKRLAEPLEKERLDKEKTHPSSKSNA
ncbi:methylmalonyl-CoA mutase subunit beta [Psychroflexus sediminis]|uniref:Heterodimeric methylmalonyl-CoA mutase small subunit n=1 Tax=Psychroflexus sediminis TaxID=470826 RepID=A0A1G7XTB2_9FLAO|nr:methylmalonyl-CoA mutase subunit beta [Psychroflexus sediminis]SDG87439.1 heterodimeric methylmalonyl-CoA mutase small subunit [Psychroflexus sediminis]